MTNWEPDIKIAMNKLNSTGGNLQNDVDKVVREMREKAEKSPLNLVGEIFSNLPSNRIK
ncbi:MAG: hypothetical protein WC770_09350 [Phycisphaerae bacterium]|jgi:hypothetical protein